MNLRPVSVARRELSASEAATTSDGDDGRRWLARAAEGYLGRRQAVAMLTLIAYVLVPPPGTLFAARVVAVVGLLLVPVVARDPRFWAVMLVIAATGTLRGPWLDLDNHHFLQLYWLAGMCLGSRARDPQEAIRQIARLLIGLAFLFATISKVISPDFIDGTFLTLLVSVEPHVDQAAVAAGWQEPELGATNRARLATAYAEQPGGAATLQVAPTTIRVAPVLSLGTVVLEGSVALVFLLPVTARRRGLSDVVLLLFTAVTYVLLPVITFGLLLAAMGVAQSELPDKLAAASYLAIALFVVLAT